MKEEWKECKLGEIVEINKNSYSEKENWKFVNYLDTGNITENKISEIQHINLSDEKLPSRAKRKVKNNSILYSTVRPNQKHFGIIKSFPENFLVSTGFAVLDVNEKLANPDFVYYYLIQNENTESLHAIAEQTTSAYPAIKPSDIANLSITLPPLATQQKIAAILSSLDDKIELNNKINDNLEQQAQAIFKSWFVDFEPFGGKMPEGWRVGKVGDLGEIICGKTPSTKIKEYYGNECPFITIPDMHNNVYACFTERYLSKLGMESQIGKSLPVNSVCVSCIATPGLVILTDKISQTNQQINSIIPNKNMSSYYVYLLMQSLAETIKMLGSSGSTTSNLNKDQFSKIDVLITAIYELKIFNSIVEPLFQNIRNNIHENQKLTALRDTLLPKLMNGEIEVDEVKV